jgi:hypothetical protein
MRPVITVIVMILAASAWASDLGSQSPPKSPSSATPNIPGSSRQGGDTIATAFPIPALPYLDTGTTTGYADDYDEFCPIDGSAPDVVYAYLPTADEAITVDLCGSNYDTKIEIYDDALNFVACNDDFYFDAACGVYTSKIMRANLSANRTYYIVVDGYGPAHGDYVLAVTIFEPCVVDRPAEGVSEGEPPLQDDYVDLWNGGCFVEPGHPFQAITGNETGMATLCGVGGWYTSGWQEFRDTDWFTLEMGTAGAIEVTIDAEESTLIFELSPQDCETVGVAQQAATECGLPATMTITGYEPATTVWFWTGSSFFAQPNWIENEYDYVLWFSGLETGVATESTTWSTVKALYE